MKTQLLNLLQSELQQLPLPAPVICHQPFRWKVPMPGASAEFLGVGLHRYTGDPANLPEDLIPRLIQKTLYLQSLGFSAESLPRNLLPELKVHDTAALILLPDQPAVIERLKYSGTFVPALLARAIAHVADANFLPVERNGSEVTIETSTGLCGLYRQHWWVNGAKLTRCSVYPPIANVPITELISQIPYATERRFLALLTYWKKVGALTPDLNLALQIARYVWPADLYKLLNRYKKGIENGNG